MAVVIKNFFDQVTATFSYVVNDVNTNKAIIIDSVLNYDQYSGKVTTESADDIIKYVKENNLSIEWILDTHIHADHITASFYLRKMLGGKIAISNKIKEVLSFWIPIFNTAIDTDINASQFDKLLENNESISFGDVLIKIMNTPGHTPACVSYVIENNIFVGDTIFMPDVGTARTDFPGGSAELLYDSIQKIFNLADDTRVYLCHDYPPEGRSFSYQTNVKEQKLANILVNTSISKEEYVKMRNKRDHGKPVPKLLYPSIQANLRAGQFGIAEDNGVKYIKIPCNFSVDI